MYSVDIKMSTNHERTIIDEALIRTINRALQYVRGNLQLNAEIISYHNSELSVALTEIETTNIDIVIDKFFSDFDGAVRALATNITKGVNNRFFSPRQFASITVKEDGRVVSAVTGEKVK